VRFIQPVATTGKQGNGAQKRIEPVVLVRVLRRGRVFFFVFSVGEFEFQERTRVPLYKSMQ
jgi:hypothetical protein